MVEPGIPGAHAPTTHATPRGSALRVGTWVLHLCLPLLTLWLLLARPALDVSWQHNLSHFVMVGACALLAVGVGLRVSADARDRGDSRLLLVSLAFLAAALFFALHALATPTVVVETPNAGFVLATPVGLLVAGAFVLAACLDWDHRDIDLSSRAGALRAGVVALALVWALVSVLRLPPLANPLPDQQSGLLLGVFAVVGGGMFTAGAVRFWQLHRRRRGAVLLSLLTAWVLLAESMVAVALGPSWQLSWWLWHLTMLAAFAFVAYAAWVQLRLEGRPAGLFEGVGDEATLRAAQAERQEALERFVSTIEAAVSSGEAVDAGELASAVAQAAELTERQAAVLQQAGTALVAQRALSRRLAALADLGAATSVEGEEADLLALARQRLLSAFPGRDVRLLLRGQDPPPPADGAVTTALWAKGHEIGWLTLAGRTADALEPLEIELLGSFAAQIALGIENRRLYRELDGLFRSYMSSEVATALIADPSQAHLGGAVAEVSVLFADLVGFTPFSEAHDPQEVVGMLNAYYGAAVPAILEQGGTVVQFVGDEVMALFNTPVRQVDHAHRAARAGLALQQRTGAIAADHHGWPLFRVGINSGPALVGNVGAEQMRNFTAIGDTTNTAARIQAAAEPGTVLIGSATFSHIAEAARTTQVGPLRMKGKAQPVTVHRLDQMR